MSHIFVFRQSRGKVFDVTSMHHQAETVVYTLPMIGLGFEHVDATHLWWYPVVTILIGFGLSQATELFKSHLTRKRDREERRIVFQRSVLADLQETLIVLVRTSGALHLQDVAMDRKQGEGPSKPYSVELQRQLEHPPSR